MVKFAGIGTGGDNVPIVGEKPQLSPSYFLNIIPCLAGCITGGAVCNYLTNTRKQETLNAIFEINDKGKKFKVVKVGQKEDQNDDREAYEELKNEDKEEFNNHKDIYGSGFSGWWNYLWKKEPIYKIVEVPEELDEKPINDQIIKNPEKSGIEFNQKLLKIDDRYDINYISNEKKQFNNDQIIKNPEKSGIDIQVQTDMVLENNKKQFNKLLLMHPNDHAIGYTSTNLSVLSVGDFVEWITNKENNINNDIIFAFFERIKDLKKEDMERLLKDDRSGNIFKFILKIFNKAGVEQIPQNLRIVILKKIIANPKVFFSPDEEQEDSEDINNKKEDDNDNNHGTELSEARVSIFLKLLPYCVEDLNFANLDDIDKNALNKLFFVMVELFNKGKIDIDHSSNEQSLFLFFSKLLQRYVDRADELPKFDGEDADNDERKFYENLLLLTIRCYSKKQELPAVGECDQDNFHHFIELILSKVKDFSFLQKEQRDKLFILIFKTYKEGEKLPSLEDDEEEEKKEEEKKEEEREEKEEEIEEREKLKKPNKKRDELFIQLFERYIRNGCLPDEFWKILTGILRSFIEKRQPFPKGFMTMLSTIFDKNIECKFSKEFWDLFIEHIEKNIHQIPDDWKKIITKTQTVDEGVQKDDEGNQVKERQLKKENVYKFVIKQPDKSKDKKNPKNLSIDKKSGGRFTYKSTGGKKGRGSKSNFSNLGISTLVPIEKNTLYKRLDGHSNVQTLVVKNKDNRSVDDVQGFEGYDIINSNGVKKNLDTNNEPNINKTQYGKKYKLVFGNEEAKKQNEALNDERKPHIRRETTVYSGYRKEFCNNESASYFNNIYKNNKKTLHGNNTGT